MAKTKASAPAEVSEQSLSEEEIRIAAYLNWEAETGGQPVDDEATRQFWLNAEKQAQPDK